MLTGEHVPGSPFSITVSGPPDPGRVRVYGPGVEPGVLSLFQSRFMCDTRGAGAGQLTVRIRGPKGQCPTPIFILFYNKATDKVTQDDNKVVSCAKQLLHTFNVDCLFILITNTQHDTTQ